MFRAARLALLPLLAWIAAVPPSAGASWTVTVEGRRAELLARGEPALLPLEPIVALFGMTASPEGKGYTAVEGAGGRALLRPGMSFALVRETPVLLSAPPRVEEGALLVPPDAVDKVLVPLAGRALEVRAEGTRLTVLRPEAPPPAVPLLHASWETLSDRERIRIDIPSGGRTGGEKPRVERRPDGLAAVLPGAPVRIEGNLPARTPLIESLRVVTLDTVSEVRIALSRDCTDADPRFEDGRLVVDLIRSTAPVPRPAGLLAQAPGTTVEPWEEEEPPGEGGTPVATPPIEDRDAAFDVVVLDPGHGGTGGTGPERGAVGPGGIEEKQVTLGIARALAEKLPALLPGVKVLLTREDDREVPLQERTAFANRNAADLFVSIHANASTRPDASGAEVYFLSSEATDEEARDLAAIEGNAVGPAGMETSGTVEMILWDMAQAQYLDQSRALAERIQKELNRVSGIGSRGVKQAPFAVLVGATMPAVLIEVGFLTNPAEEKRLAKNAEQEKIATAIARAIAAYPPSRGATEPSAR